MSKLHSPVKVGRFTFAHRIVLAPLTRMRAEEGARPGALMAEYYAQRTSQGGFLIGEATIAAPNGNGYLGAPGLFDDSQIAGWKHVTDAVHAKGGKIFLQLYHAGRQSNVDVQPANSIPVGPSEVLHGGVAYTTEGWVPNTPNRALTIEEIADLVENFRSAAERGVKAGFDGVELHGANGYLIDQFLRDSNNFRSDAYGGSIDNRIRLLKEVTEAVAGVIGADRTGVRLTPSSYEQGIRDSDPEALFIRAAEVLSSIGIAHLEVREPALDGTFGKSERPPLAGMIREVFKGVLILNSDYGFAKAQAQLDAGLADAIAFGRPFIGNPDLPLRFARRLPLVESEMSTWFSQGREGYLDYPTSGSV